MRLNLGCGSDIREGFVNVDIASMAGVDVVIDLSTSMWPFRDNVFEEVILINVLEHLPDTVKAVEEIHRIAKAGADIVIRVPYWNCWQFAVDPTHLRWFHQQSFDFFDPRRRACKERPYYSKARFEISQVNYWVALVPSGRAWVLIKSAVLKAVLGILAQYFNSVIWVLDFNLRVLK